jgi:hypothetical protein
MASGLPPASDRSDSREQRVTWRFSMASFCVRPSARTFSMAVGGHPGHPYDEGGEEGEHPESDCIGRSGWELAGASPPIGAAGQDSKAE